MSTRRTVEPEATEEPAAVTRAERRVRTRAAILAAARETFAANGFQRATIRAVADRAGCDPALVMQHFGSKTELFQAATAVHLDMTKAIDGPAETLYERVLRHTFAALDEQAESVASTLRTMLTRDEVAEEALRLFNPPERPPADQGDGPGEPDPLAALRADLMMSLTLGTAITRYVLRSPAVHDATRDELLSCLLPAVEALRPPPVTAGRPVDDQPADDQPVAERLPGSDPDP